MNTGMPRKRKSETVIYTIGGEVSVTEKNARYDFLVREGQLVYLPSGDAATLRIPEDAKAVIIKFDLPERLFEDAFCIKKDSETLETAGKLCEYTDRDHAFSCIMTYKLIYEMKKYVKGQAPQKFHILFPVKHLSCVNLQPINHERANGWPESFIRHPILFGVIVARYGIPIDLLLRDFIGQKEKRAPNIKDQRPFRRIMKPHIFQR